MIKELLEINHIQAILALIIAIIVYQIISIITNRSLELALMKVSVGKRKHSLANI